MRKESEYIQSGLPRSLEIRKNIEVIHAIQLGRRLRIGILNGKLIVGEQNLLPTCDRISSILFLENQLVSASMKEKENAKKGGRHMTYRSFISFVFESDEVQISSYRHVEQANFDQAASTYLSSKQGFETCSLSSGNLLHGYAQIVAVAQHRRNATWETQQAMTPMFYSIMFWGIRGNFQLRSSRPRQVPRQNGQASNLLLLSIGDYSHDPQIFNEYRSETSGTPNPRFNGMVRWDQTSKLTQSVSDFTWLCRWHLTSNHILQIYVAQYNDADRLVATKRPVDTSAWP